MKVVGHFGSAGCSRSLRRTATAVGVGSTANVQRRMRDDKLSAPAKLEDPLPEQLREWIAAGRCWWCKSERIFKSLSSHWTRAHGLDLQHLRDILGVPKKQSFICEETRNLFAERGKRLYDPAKLCGASLGTKRVMSAYGKAVNRAKLGMIDPDERYAALARRAPEDRQRCIEKMHAAARIVSSKRHEEYEARTKKCVICGTVMHGRRATLYKTCGEPCRVALISQSNRVAFGEGGPYHRPGASKVCVVCGAEFRSTGSTSNRKTCGSEECTHALRSTQAKKRTEHIAIWQAMGRQAVIANNPSKRPDVREKISAAARKRSRNRQGKWVGREQEPIEPPMEAQGDMSGVIPGSV